MTKELLQGLQPPVTSHWLRGRAPGAEAQSSCNWASSAGQTQSLTLMAMQPGAGLDLSPLMSCTWTGCRKQHHRSCLGCPGQCKQGPMPPSAPRLCHPSSSGAHGSTLSERSVTLKPTGGALMKATALSLEGSLICAQCEFI